VTLVELSIAAALLGVAVLTVMGPFRYLAFSSQFAKARSIANNLAQEQIEFLKAKSYYSLLVTTATTNDTRFDPAIAYDAGYYPVQSLVQGGVRFLRATRVELVYQSGANLIAVPATNEDTGLKQITVFVMWQDGSNWKQMSLQNLMSSAQTAQLTARISGTVTRQGTGTPIRDAQVQAIENANFTATTDASGNYSFQVSPGSYTVTSSSGPFFPQTTASVLNVPSGANITANLVMTLMSSASVTTDLYVQDHVVISQVVSSTGPSGEEEYFELYNPTPNPIPMGVGSPGSAGYWADYRSYFYYYNKDHDWHFTWLTYVSTYIPPYGYYLISNSPTIHAGGVTRTADAHYTNGFSWKEDVGAVNFEAPSHMIEIGEGGGLYFVRKIESLGVWYVDDRFGWCKGAGGPPAGVIEGSCFTDAAGLGVGEQFVRMSTPGVVAAAYGPSYDSGDNSKDFVKYIPIAVPPSTVAVTKPALTGGVAFGAWTNLTDPLSTGGSCVSTVLGGGQRVCRFTTYAATGTWTAISFVPGVYADHNYFLQTDNVTVGATGVSIPNATTLPTWSLSPHSYSVLNATTSNAYVAGTVYNIYGNPLNGIQVQGVGGQTVTTSVSGRYFLYLPAGASQVVANPNSASSNYSSETLNLATTAGVLYDPQNFFLSQAGSLRGYFKTSSNQPLPNRVAVALQGTTQMGQASSDGTGYFYIRNVSTGAYTVVPMLDSAEGVSPSSASVTLATPGTTVFVGTFTVSNGLSEVTGNVTAGGVAINTGVLVVATTATLAGGASTPAPSLTGAGSCSPCYYEASSDATGVYALSLRSNATPYNIYGWYTVFNGTAPVSTRIGPFAVTVSSASATYTRHLTW
jgi:hypothetical protein